jgi:hypothetical protein
MVGWWVEALETGAWIYNRELGQWERHDDRLPRERQASRVV